MRVLLDTHMLIWILNGYEHLIENREFMDLYMNEIDDIYFSAVSIWEIELKKMIGKANFTYDGREIYHAALDSNMTPLPLFPKNSLRLEEDELPHKDPFDRMLLAQAMDNDLVLLTHDSKFKDINDRHVRYLAID
ncbi:MAG: type II toxin-antitoxin system VapC family toxin [Erysipelotrichaceae bacterium]|nr:type II toxin-antitoxin system VapC family toxin [Erysipelotrichaceae bacterium]